MVTKKSKVYLINGGSLSLPLPIKQILLIFSAVSFAITALDVTLAHSQNNFIPIYEWIPMIFAPIAAIISFVFAFYEGHSLIRNLYKTLMIFGILMGIIGSLFHIFGNISVNKAEVLDWLVFGTPVFAPVAFTGMSLFGLALINPNPQRLMRLIAIGFMITAFTAFFDHAQTDFETPYTLIPVISGFFAFIFMWLNSRNLKEIDSELCGRDITLGNMYYAVMLIMIIVGVIGFYLHVTTNLEATTQFNWARMIYKTPVLAPLIFAQMGALGILASLTDTRIRISMGNK